MIDLPCKETDMINAVSTLQNAGLPNLAAMYSYLKENRVNMFSAGQKTSTLKATALRVQKLMKDNFGIVPNNLIDTDEYGLKSLVYFCGEREHFDGDKTVTAPQFIEFFALVVEELSAADRKNIDELCATVHAHFTKS